MESKIIVILLLYEVNSPVLREWCFSFVSEDNAALSDTAVPRTNLWESSSFAPLDTSVYEHKIRNCPQASNQDVTLSRLRNLLPR